MHQEQVEVTGPPADLCVELVGGSHTELRTIRDSLLHLQGLSVRVKEPFLQMSGPVANEPGIDATLVMVDGDGDGAAALQCIQNRAAVKPRSALIAVVTDRSAGMMRKILGAGADELLFYPLDTAPVTRTMLQVLRSRERLKDVNRGKICVVTSTAGGVGVTTVSANLALALRYALNKRVALVDLDARSGGLAAHLNLEPTKTIASLARHGSSINSIELGLTMAKHPSGIYLLASPAQITELDEMAPTATGAILDLMKDLFDFVIVDCGGTINRHVVTAWERAELLMYVLDQSVNSMRCAWRFAEMCEQMKLGHTEPRFIINRFDPNHPVSEEQIEYALGSRIFAKLAADEKVMAKSEARGVDIWQLFGGSALAKSYENLAAAIVNKQEAAEPSDRNVFTKLLAAVGATQLPIEKQAA